MDIALSVIIVNYNGVGYLKDCLNSLYEKMTPLAFEIIIIDNNSADNSCQYIKDKYPGVVLIESKINYGFGKGNNEAVKKAKGEYLLLLNNDTILLDNQKPVLDFLKCDSSIGAVGINMVNAKKEYMPPGGKFPNIQNMFRLKNLFDNGVEFETGNFEKESYDIDWLGGSYLMMPKSVYLEVGGFDEDFFMYVEDVDLCKKIADKGYRRVFLPHFSYIHFVGFTTAKNPMLIKGYEIYIAKHFHGMQKTLVAGALQINKWVKKAKTLLKMQ